MKKAIVEVVAVLLVGALLVALVIRGENRRRQCFEHCQLRKVGREFREPGAFYVVERCEEHDRTFLEPVPETVWMEYRRNGLPELRIGSPRCIQVMTRFGPIAIPTAGEGGGE